MAAVGRHRPAVDRPLAVPAASLSTANAMADDSDGFNPAAINAAMGRQMLKDMIGAFDTEGA